MGGRTPGGSERPHRDASVKAWIKLLISAGLLALLFVLLPWRDVWTALTRLPPGTWIAVLLGFLAGHALGVLKWQLVVNAGRASLAVLDAVMCYGAGLFANMCLPSLVGGDVLRAALVSMLTRRPEAALFGGVLDRVSDLAALGVLVTVGGIAARHALPGWGAQALTVVIVVTLALGVVFLPLVLKRPLHRWPPRFRRRIGRSLVALRRLSRSPGTALAVFALSLSIQASFVLLNAWLGRAIGITVPLSVWFLTWPLAKAASLLPISLGGLAVREATLAGLLLPFGVPAALGVVASLLWQTVLIVGGLFGGLMWWALSRRASVSTRTGRRVSMLSLGGASRPHA